MISSVRAKVLWFGKGDPSSLSTALDDLGGFELSVVTDESNLAAQLSFARAAIFEFDGDVPLFIARVRRMKPGLLENGVLIGFIDGSRDPATFEVATAHAIGDDVQSYGPGTSTFTPFQSFRRNFHFAAHQICMWDPGPSSNDDLKISGGIDPTHQFLIRRAFSDFRAVRGTLLKGGASGAKVYCIAPLEQPRTPFLAKVDETDRIAAENDRYDKWVHATVGFNHRPNLNKSRTVYTSRKSVLVEEFLERCQPIYELLPFSNPAVLIASIFEGALRNWRRDSQLQCIAMAEHHHFSEILNRRDPTFFAAGEYAKKKLRAPYDGEELLEACKRAGPMTCTWNRIHGDLHAGNLYVSAGSSDVVLIDFHKTDTGPAVADPACLEVDLIFNRTKRASKALALRIYKCPIEIPSLHTSVGHGYDWLLDTIRAIRMMALSEVDRAPYAFALACYLIRYSSFADNGTERRRAVAACIASQLIRSLVNAKK